MPLTRLFPTRMWMQTVVRTRKSASLCHLAKQSRRLARTSNQSRHLHPARQRQQMQRPKRSLQVGRVRTVKAREAATEEKPRLPPYTQGEDYIADLPRCESRKGIGHLSEIIRDSKHSSSLCFYLLTSTSEQTSPEPDIARVFQALQYRGGIAVG